MTRAVNSGRSERPRRARRRRHHDAEPSVSVARLARTARRRTRRASRATARSARSIREMLDRRPRDRRAKVIAGHVRPPVRRRSHRPPAARGRARARPRRHPGRGSLVPLVARISGHRRRPRLDRVAQRARPPTPRSPSMRGPARDRGGATRRSRPPAGAVRGPRCRKKSRPATGDDRGARGGGRAHRNASMAS